MIVNDVIVYVFIMVIVRDDSKIVRDSIKVWWNPDALGIISRARLMSSRYASLVYPRRMISSTRELPLWAGMCMLLQMFGVLAIRVSTSSGKSC
jgi:hypothetical protein